PHVHCPESLREYQPPWSDLHRADPAPIRRHGDNRPSQTDGDREQLALHRGRCRECEGEQRRREIQPPYPWVGPERAHEHVALSEPGSVATSDLKESREVRKVVA